MKTQMHEKQRYLVLSAMFAAIIALTITYLFHIPTGVTGYIHLGDAFIYLAGSFLPAPYACAAAALGGGLADIMSGSAIWAIPTMIIKPLTALWFTNKGDKMLNRRNIIAMFGAGVVSIVGYYVAEAIMYGNWVAALASMGPNLIQSAGSAVLFSVMALAVDRASLKQKLLGEQH
ncbi:MAG: TIGR04002 family protein [Negativibacillus sp.]|nr:TIGR04002 family protein [Negativibacillus sp.]